MGAAGRVAICFLRSARRNRNCLATREGGTTAVNATAWAQSAWGIGLVGVRPRLAPVGKLAG